ncbi:MAG TPA: hypothetical protein ACFE0H_06225 [Elainellaceae cyanobacterium]
MVVTDLPHLAAFLLFLILVTALTTLISRFMIFVCGRLIWDDDATHVSNWGLRGGFWGGVLGAVIGWWLVQDIYSDKLVPYLAWTTLLGAFIGVLVGTLACEFHLNGINPAPQSNSQARVAFGWMILGVWFGGIGYSLVRFWSASTAIQTLYPSNGLLIGDEPSVLGYMVSGLPWGIGMGLLVGFLMGVWRTRSLVAVLRAIVVFIGTTLQILFWPAVWIAIWFAFYIIVSQPNEAIAPYLAAPVARRLLAWVSQTPFVVVMGVSGAAMGAALHRGIKPVANAQTRSLFWGSAWLIVLAIVTVISWVVAVVRLGFVSSDIFVTMTLVWSEIASWLLSSMVVVVLLAGIGGTLFGWLLGRWLGPSLEKPAEEFFLAIAWAIFWITIWLMLSSGLNVFHPRTTNDIRLMQIAVRGILWGTMGGILFLTTGRHIRSVGSGIKTGALFWSVFAGITILVSQVFAVQNEYVRGLAFYGEFPLRSVAEQTLPNVGFSVGIGIVLASLIGAIGGGVFGLLRILSTVSPIASPSIMDHSADQSPEEFDSSLLSPSPVQLNSADYDEDYTAYRESDAGLEDYDDSYHGLQQTSSADELDPTPANPFTFEDEDAAKSVPPTQQPGVLDLARQGNGRAIATLMNRHLQPRGITVKARLKTHDLHIMLEGDDVPPADASVNFVRQGLTNLNAESVHRVKLYGRKQGISTPAWRREFEIVRL